MEFFILMQSFLFFLSCLILNFCSWGVISHTVQANSWLNKQADFCIQIGYSSVILQMFSGGRCERLWALPIRAIAVCFMLLGWVPSPGEIFGDCFWLCWFSETISGIYEKLFYYPSLVFETKMLWQTWGGPSGIFHIKSPAGVYTDWDHKVFLFFFLTSHLPKFSSL